MKLCECGCGSPAPVAQVTNARRGQKKGEPLRFVHGHSGRLQGSLRERLLSRLVVDFDGPRPVDGSPCWLWTGQPGRGGYCQIRCDGRMAYIHRVAYEMWFGRIPGGLPAASRGKGPDVDHLCRNRACANPAHLEVVPHRVNILRGETVNAISAAKESCPAGHDYTEANTYVTTDGRRNCRICRGDRGDYWRAYQDANRDRINAQRRARRARQRTGNGAVRA